MSQDIVSDALNMMMNAKRSRKNSIKLKRYSNFLFNVLEIAKNVGYVKSYEVDKEKKILSVEFSLNKCEAIKPRFNVTNEEIEKYVRRYLPARDFGIIIISTSKGLMTNAKTMENKLGGSLIAYFY